MGVIGLGMDEVTTPVESVEKDSTIEIESVNTNEIIEEPKTEDTETFLDPNLLDKVQTAAETLAGELDQLLGSISTSLHSVCSFSSGYMDTYCKASERLAETVTVNGAGMYGLISKVKQLNDELDKVDTVHEEIKDIKKTLDILELLAPRLTPKVTPGGP